MRTPWTHVLEDFSQGLVSANEVVKAFAAIRCTHNINSKQQHGIVISACSKSVTRCDLCDEFYVIKVSQGAVLENRRGYGVFANEVASLMQVNAAMRTLRPEFQLYRDFVLAYVKHYVSPSNDIVLVTRFVPYEGTDPKTMRELVARDCSTRALCVMIIQVFMTLEVIAKCVPGFVHMDLLMSQIFLRRWTSEKTQALRVDAKTTFKLPKQDFWPVIGDFGFAVTNKVKDVQFDAGEVHIVQDVYRFFYDLRHYAKDHKALRGLTDTLIDEVFGGRFYSLETHRGYLSASECKRLGRRIESYIDVMAYSNTLMRFS